jgi:hypothetical protein
VRLKEDNERLEKDLQASLASVAKNGAKIEKLTTMAERNKTTYEKVTLQLAKCKVELTSQRERIKSLTNEVAGLQAQQGRGKAGDARRRQRGQGDGQASQALRVQGVGQQRERDPPVGAVGLAYPLVPARWAVDLVVRV